MSELKPPTRPWVARGRDVYAGRKRIAFSVNAATDEPLNMREDVERAMANARFIAEAGTVFHNTGLSPVQLVEIVKELKAASKHCEDLLWRHEINRVNGEELADTALAMLRAALAKCEGVK